LNVANCYDCYPKDTVEEVVDEKLKQLNVEAQLLGENKESDRSNIETAQF
jgi:hypothetical protein